VEYASRALTNTEQNYAQIEKELLAILFALERFDSYVYLKQDVTVETDRALHGPGGPRAGPGRAGPGPGRA
jgi:hypothetical protein